MKDYRDVIIRPIITEATMKMMAEDNKVTFEVVKGVSKIEIAKAVEAAFNVEVVKVNTMNCKPKTKRVGRYVGKTSAVVCIDCAYPPKPSYVYRRCHVI